MIGRPTCARRRAHHARVAGKSNEVHMKLKNFINNFEEIKDEFRQFAAKLDI